MPLPNITKINLEENIILRDQVSFLKIWEEKQRILVGYPKKEMKC